MEKMPFTSAREAKEYLVSRISDEAQRQGTALSELERKMLYFSETAWAPEDIASTAELFDHECDQSDYEQKIAELVQKSRQRACQEGKDSVNAWDNAIRTLSNEDHYLLVMVAKAGAGVRPRGDYLRLLLTALAILLVGACVVYFASIWESHL